MDRGTQERHLLEAERHIAEGERHIADQEALILDLDAHGHDTALARKLLDSFRATQLQHIAHRDFIVREIES